MEQKLQKIYISCQFIDWARFMGSSLSNLVNNLPEKIYRIKCKYGHDNKKRETCGIKYKYYNCFLESIILKDGLKGYKCLCCNKNYQHKFDKNLKEQLFNTFKISNYDSNKFIFLL